jgi:hypothetical protein
MMYYVLERNRKMAARVARDRRVSSYIYVKSPEDFAWSHPDWDVLLIGKDAGLNPWYGMLVAAAMAAGVHIAN